MVYQKNKTRVKYNVLRNKRARINKIRKEIKFDGIQALKNQIKSDILEVAHQ